MLFFANYEMIISTLPTIRFEGEDDKTFDHTMTQAELSALQTLYSMFQVETEFSMLIDRWASGTL